MRPRSINIILLFTVLLLLSCARKSPDLIVACGWDEVFIADISQDVPQKVWTWTGEDSEGLPSFMRNKFLTTDECKPVNGGKKILITSSGGGVALVERETGNTLFYASVPNAHSAELLPNDLLIAAASFSTEGNRLNLYSTLSSDIVIYSDSLYGAHGVQWDNKRDLLWALGTNELRSYTIEKDVESVKLRQELTIPLPDKDGHDLVFLDNKNSLCLTTANGVWYYSIDDKQFSKHPSIGKETKIKSISYSKHQKETIYVKATDETWWAYYIRFAGSKKVVYLPGEKIYKVRWLYN